MSSHPTSSSPSPYEALPLSYGEIRVLEVAAASGDEILECTLERISLLDHPVPCYETISYCWGPHRDPSTIKLNGHLVEVPASSEAAVRRMRLRDRPRVLWIDAICIDQSSMTERSAQVAFMATVYSTAKQNLVYLGEDHKDMAVRGIKALEDVMDDMRAETADFTLAWETMSNLETGSWSISNEPFSASIDFEALEALFSHHWFSFGNGVGLRCASEMFKILYPHSRWVSTRGHLATMFMTIRQSEKSEPKDSIFAILGLLDKDTSLENSQAALLKVDYTKPLSSVLRDATRYALCQGGGLSPFNMIDHDFDVLNDPQSFPTWAIRADLQREAWDAVLLPNHFNASGGLEAPSLLEDVSFGEEVLLLEGLAVDEIYQTTASCLRSTWETYEDFHEWLISVKGIVLRHCNIPSQEELFLATTFTLVAGSTYHGMRAQSSDLHVLVEYFKSLTVCENAGAAGGIGIKNGFDLAVTRSIYDDSRVDYCLDRRFFVTGAGRVGIGPRCMQPGDVVVVLRGGRWPFIMRKKGDDYWLLGAAYVHGIMDGEVVQLHNARGGSEEVFHVR
ncbi:uncharacterized protein J4E79_008697 [Alternaria viburni]|uniref:uncharacterized protein n=1 Tax=Alternaria viburni TaxID=566460 RepID=UPI0020C4C9C2|nr:uncharacterized protein J4E79_008697 [Alternaria viburni]KAI4653184.1 hypothetical protein J4E79_008697 [Alternaria viburni]